MITLQEVKKRASRDPQNWAIFLMDFVDDFRFHKSLAAVAEPIQPTDSRMDALLASTAEYLCDELSLETPDWLATVPACPSPWFVAGMENLKAIALAESPLRFRIRKIFVLENFLSRA
ncbi:MAG: hypothetical protein DWI57_16535 [Chloroflexi bacterium]|nr:MAG: hypothetical protein DWI57_16535 [Chloroflexota bacterium]